MELVKEQRDLIEKLVKSNPKYSGNEDLLDDFCSETYQKSYLILQSIEDTNTLESYLRKVVSSAIMDVLKNSGRILRTSKGYNNVKEIPISHVKKSDVKKETETDSVSDVTENIATAVYTAEENVEQQEEIVELEDDTVYDNSNIHLKENVPPEISGYLSDIKDPRDSIEEQIIRKDILENIIKMVINIDEEKPKELYLKIFYSRYFLQKKQKEIAQETELSQSEISKRLVKLSRLIKEKLY